MQSARQIARAHPDGDDVRRRILDAAEEVFAGCGYAAATTRGIAQRAGIGKRMLFYYFPNKDALVVALVERELESERERLLAILAPARTPRALAAQLHAFGETLVELHARRPALHRTRFDPAAPPPIKFMPSISQMAGVPLSCCQRMSAMLSPL